MALAAEVASQISEQENIEFLTKSKQKTMIQQFDVVNQRITIRRNTMLALLGSFITMILALFVHIAWDRRTHD